MALNIKVAPEAPESVKIKEKICKERIPDDRYHIAYLIFYLLGCGTLLPWNFFITANEYFKVKLQSKPSLVSTFQNYFSIASMGPNLLIMILNVFVMHKYSRYIRISISITIVMLMFCFTSLLVLLNTTKWTTEFFILTMVTMVIISSAGSLFQGALFGMAGMFPSRYIQAVMAGQGLGGFLACIASILSMIGDGDPKRSAFGYFCTGTFVLVVSLIAYIALEKLAIVKYYTRDKNTCFCTCKCDSGCHRNDHSERSKKLDSVNSKINEINSKSSGFTVENKFSLILSMSRQHIEGDPQYLKIFKKILPAALSAFMIFFLTLSIFPSTTARIRSVSSDKNDWTEKFFVPVGCFLVYNTFDVVGKTMPSFIQKPSYKYPWFLFILCCCRVAFLPLFVFCNVQPRINGSVLFNHDAFPIIFMMAFSLTNGYLGSLAVMYGPKFVSPNHAEVAATTLAFCIVAGLAAGAAFSFLIAPNI